MTPTPEQLAIVEAATATQDNLILIAYAGAAKTTTLILITKALSSIPILTLAFNKRIADEMRERLPDHVKSATFNSIGHRIWAQACAKNLTLDTSKMFKITGEVISAHREKALAQKQFVDILNAAKLAKAAGYIPEGAFPGKKSLISLENFLTSLEDDIDFPDILDAILIKSITQAYAGNIDFDDQIYMPTLFGGTFPKFPLVCIDEAQDLSPLNHEMLAKLVYKRLIAVGDPYQSIYGFRGAMQDGMANLAVRFKMKTLKLSISFRCPTSVVEAARFRVPDMQWFEGAEEGVVRHMTSWSVFDIPDNATIICRNNAPLFRLALHLLRNKRSVSVPGNDIGPKLLKILKSFGDPNLPSHKVKAKINEWTAAEIAKRKRSRSSIEDRAECLMVFAEAADTLEGALAYAIHLFAQDGTITLISGHKSKGLEFDHVFHLDSWRIRDDDEQELNVRYVITTRAKSTLTHINMEELIP